MGKNNDRGNERFKIHSEEHGSRAVFKHNQLRIVSVVRLTSIRKDWR